MSRNSRPTAPRPRQPPAEKPLCAVTVKQLEERQPGTAGRVRGWIHRADAGDAAFAWLRPAVIRIGRSVLIDELRFVEGLRQRSEILPAPDRRLGQVVRRAHGGEGEA